MTAPMDFGDKEFNYGAGFPTPFSLPETTACRTFQIPADEDNGEWQAIFMGLLLSLTDPDNWVQFEGAMDREDAAARWLDMIWQAYEDAPDGCAEADMVSTPFWDDSDGSDASDEAPADEQDWYGVWDGETFVEALSYWAVTAFLATGVSEGAAIEFITPLRAFRLRLRANPHGAKLLVLMDSNIFQLVDLFRAEEEVVTVDIVSPGSTLMLVHSGEHNPSATPDSNGNYPVEVIKSYLTVNDVIPPNVRYTDDDPPIFQTTADGTTWVDSPAADPRYNTIYQFPALTPYSGIECDAATRIIAQLQDTLDHFLESATTAQFATIVIQGLLLLLGPAGWLIDAIVLAGEGLTIIGTTNIEDAFTDEVWDDLTCILQCFMSDDATITLESSLLAWEAMKAAHPGVVANVLGELQYFYGNVLFSNAAIERTETGDCSECGGCSWRYRWDFNTSDGDFVFDSEAGNTGGIYVGGGSGYEKASTGISFPPYDCGRKSVTFDVPSDCHITDMKTEQDPQTLAENTHIECYIGSSRSGGLAQNPHIYTDHWSDTLTATGDISDQAGVHCTFEFAGNDSTGSFFAIELGGTGTPPDFVGGAFI